MASGNVTLTTNSANVPSGFINDLIRAIRFQMVLQKTVNLDIKWDKSLGQTVHQQRTVNWDKATKVPNTDIVATAFTVPGDELLYIDTFDYSAAQIEDFARLFIPDSIIDDIATSQAYALNRAVESTLANQFQSFTQTVSGTALNTELTWAHLTTANRLLQVAGIDVDAGNVTFVMTPQQMEVFKQNNIFMDTDLAGSDGPDNLSRSTLVQKKILGARVIWSNLLRAPAAGGHDMAMYHKNAIALCYAQKPQWFEQNRALPLGKICGFSQAYGTKRSFRHAESPGSLSLTDNWAVYLPGL